MIYDAGIAVRPGAELSADICIVGSGAAAISMAHKLRASGKQIIVLEGSRVNPQPYVLQSDALHDCHVPASHKSQLLYGGSVGSFVARLDPRFLTNSRLRCYGGSTNCWGGWTRPMDSVDFDRSDLHPLCVWPIARDDLRAAYDLAIQYCSLGAWSMSAYDDLDCWRHQIHGDIAPMAWRPEAGVRNGIIAIINRSGVLGGRLAFQVAWGPDIEEADNVSIYRNANARYLESVSRGSSVQQVCVSTLSGGRPGHDFVVRADRYVLAAGGIETVRLLLVSDELGNHHNRVGKCFMVHPVNEDAARFVRGPALNRAVLNYHLGARIKHGDWRPTIVAIVMPTADALRRRGIGNCRLRLASETTISFTWEQVPNLDSRITLDAQCDPFFSDRLVRVDWQPTALDVRTLKIGASTILDELVDHGYVKSYELKGDITSLGQHHMGGTRMSRNPADGVVDRNCRVHGVDNLYVASSSVFSTGGFANPTLTIIALGLRLAAHLTS